jgi:hypothetical protein
MECAFRNRASTRINTQASPRELMRRFHFDALTHDPHSLRLLIDQVGADHIAIGTDIHSTRATKTRSASLKCPT